MIAGVRGTTEGFTASSGGGRSGTDVESLRLLRYRCDDDDGASDVNFVSSSPEIGTAIARRRGRTPASAAARAGRASSTAAGVITTGSMGTTCWMKRATSIGSLVSTCAGRAGSIRAAPAAVTLRGGSEPRLSYSGVPLLIQETMVAMSLADSGWPPAGMRTPAKQPASCAAPRTLSTM